MKETHKDLALGFKRDYEEMLIYIKTFEDIIKNIKFNKKTKNSAKELLKTFYYKRDEYAGKAKYYRKIYNAPEGCQRSLGWRKDRT